MTEETRNSVTFDRSFWPETGTKIPGRAPYDLNDLWEDFPDQAAVFVAEAILGQAPGYGRVRVSLTGAEPLLEIGLWVVGVDLMVTRLGLSRLIKEDYNDYDVIYGDPQAEDVRQRISGLEKLQLVIVECKKHLNGLLEAWASK